MGIYSTDYSDNSVIANEAYATSFGAMQMVVEAKENDLAMFNALIGRDLEEAAANASGNTAVMEQVEVLTEGAINNIWLKVVELAKKIAAKVAAIFEKFITKLAMLFTRDNATLIKKYQDKFLGKDLTKMAVKGYRKPKTTNLTDDSILQVNAFKDIDYSKFAAKTDVDDIRKATRTAGNLLSETIGSSKEDITTVEYNEEAEKKFFEDKKDVDGIDKSEMNDIVTILSGKKILADVKKKKTDILSALTKIQKAAESKKKEEAKLEDNDDRTIALAKVNAHISEISAAQSAVGVAFTTWNRCIKAAISQARRVFTMGVSYTPKTEATLLAAFGEAAEIEVEAFFDDLED